MRRAFVAGHVCVDLIPELAALPRSNPGELEQIGPLAMSAGGCVSNTGGALAELDVPVQVVGVLATSLDLAVLDPRSPAAGEHWPALLRRVLPHVDVITPSLDDLRTTLDPAIQGGPEGLGRCARRLVDMGAAIAMVTGGSAGAHLCTADPARLDAAGALFAGSGAFRDRWSVRDQAVAPPEVPVRTTVGAGDAATAGLLFGLLTAQDPDWTLELAMRAAGRRLAGAAITTDAVRGREISWRP
jgi:sugar/nucleoside kinase (ribokinase family)